MTESYAAQDNDYLTTHHTQATTPSGNPPATPNFLATSSSGSSQASSSDDSTAQRSSASVAGPTPTTATAAAPCGTSGISSSSGHAPTTAPAAVSITGCVSPTKATAVSLPKASGLEQGRTSFCHRKNSSSGGMESHPWVAESVAHLAGACSSVSRGIKRRGSDSCIVLMAVSRQSDGGRKRRSLESPASQQRNAETAASSRDISEPRPSAAPGAWPDDVRAANMRKSHGHLVPRDYARRNGGRGRAASLSPAMRPRAVPRRLPVAGASSEITAEARGPAISFGSGSPRALRRRVADTDCAAQAVHSTPARAPAGTSADSGRTPQQLGSGVSQASRTHASTLPPVNRYTLRELKIHNILQNPRLRHEVLFEPKLEFRPNSSGQLAEAKQRAAQQYWTSIDHEVRTVMVTPTANSVAIVLMLVVELREILAEMCEDSPKAELAQHAVELRERIDEACVRQQLTHGVFDAAALMTYITALMRLHAQPTRHAAIARLSVYVQRGRLGRALRGAFDVLEAIKIDTANTSIDMYREYMRSTAVAFERSHFNLAVRRNTIALEDTTAWWRRALDEARSQGQQRQGLDAVFYAAARELVLDDSQTVPTLFRMDEARIQGIQREAERLSVVGMVFLAFSQFLQLVGRGARPAAFVGANGRLDPALLAAECLQLVPEGCGVQWAEPLLGTRAVMGASTRGDVGFSQLVEDLVVLAERTLARVLTPTETAMLERTLLRAARHECALREVVEDRVGSALCDHTRALAALNGKSRGTECEAMPEAARDTLRRSMLLFLAPPLSSLAAKIHVVVSHHWHVYKAFYATVSSSSHSDAARDSNDKSKNGDSSAGAGSGEATRSATAETSTSANTISAR
ncbi:cAMP-mediated signaling protein sok1 [Coemansia sp. RSA 1972]|nr:cAMP-mediated signaling protein sok1 [Coemansia sp. RSA 1972]